MNPPPTRGAAHYLPGTLGSAGGQMQDLWYGAP